MIGIFISDSCEDKYAHTLGFLDHLYGISPDTQELFLAKMKNLVTKEVSELRKGEETGIFFAE